MAKKIYRIVTWGLLALTLASILLILRKPSVRTVDASAEGAKSFDEKLSQLDEARQPRPAREIHITEVELNSKLQESLQTTPSTTGGPAALKAATVRLEGDRAIGTFTVNLSGRDVYVTLGGKLGVNDRRLEFTPSEARIGSLPVPLAVVESRLRDQLNSPQMRERMKLPESIKDIRIANSELIVEAQ